MEGFVYPPRRGFLPNKSLMGQQQSQPYQPLTTGNYAQYYGQAPMQQQTPPPAPLRPQMYGGFGATTAAPSTSRPPDPGVPLAAQGGRPVWDPQQLEPGLPAYPMKRKQPYRYRAVTAPPRYQTRYQDESAY